ncbi:MAG TPA: ribose 5-phosphate isomerase A [Solirubrobacteraceae bacterium]|jgi:ribose 5-phosphate isomerase A|nr:ribose 5-phosphate isomerase A [Solirubrobacteraceae bacterium]
MASPRATARQPSPLSDADRERYKRAAARAAAEMIEDGMRVGLGTGTTVAHLLPAIAERGLENVRCAATSPGTEQAARALGLRLEDLDELGGLDIAIDGADQIDPEAWLVKGGGGALTREKIVAAAAKVFVVIASEDKAVARLEPPVPLELMRFGVRCTLELLAHAQLRKGAESPDGGLIADYLGAVGDPRLLSERLSATPGVVEHGLFAPELVSVILIAGEDGVQRRLGRKPPG